MEFSNKKRIIVQILSLAGFVLTIKLAMIYYVANYEKYALASFCSINDFIDCDGAARTSVSQFWGIPLAYWGMFFYITVFFLTIVDKLKNIKFLKFLEVFKNPAAYITVLGTFAFICSMILAGISVYGIKKLCILCLVTYFVDFAIALTPPAGFKDYLYSFKTTFLDFISGAKKYPKTLISLVIAASLFLTYSAVTDNFVPHIKKNKEIKKYFKMKQNPYRQDGNTLGVENADVVIDLYSDFVCPLCYVHNIMLHKAVSEYKNIKIIHHNLPFDKECNKLIPVDMHKGACIMARAALAAKKQGNYWGMSTLLYNNHPKNFDEIIKLSDELGFDRDKFVKDTFSKEISAELNKELEESYILNLDSTPTMYVNGDKKVGIMSYEELKRLLEEHGAKRK